MSSGFVPGGTIDEPAERDDAWRVAQQEIEEKRRLKAEQEQQNGGKSLYEVLQANKAAKQDAFEEATRLKNQYRALDDDEAEFLDSVLESTRKQEAAVRKETSEQLDLFRKYQGEAERKALAEDNAASPPAEQAAQWGMSSRKRKKGHEKDGGLLRGVKLRKTSIGAEVSEEEARKAVAHEQKRAHNDYVKKAGAEDTPRKSSVTEKSTPQTEPPGVASSPPKAAASMSLALGYGSSDEDD